MERLLGLSASTKKLIIQLLERSIERKEEPEEKKNPSSMDAFGAWVGPESAEEIIGWIENSRTIGSEREPLDRAPSTIGKV